MNSIFPDTPDFKGPLAPVRIEGKVINLEVQGTIPKDIKGTFIRVQPDPLYPPMLGNDIFFNGDGVVSSFQFSDGHVDLVQRYVETDRLKLQRDAERSLFGLYRNPYTNDESVSQKNVYSTANTNIVQFQNKLLALKEDNLPYAMDPVTLETLGVDDLDGQFTARTFTAHPRVDPETNHFLTYSYRAKGEQSKDVAFYEFNDKGEKVKEIWFEAPLVPFIHDFCFTQNYLIFPVIPLDHNQSNGEAGGAILQWNYERDILFGVIKRHGDGSDARWFRLPNGFPGHLQNTFEKDGKIYCDLSIGDDNVFSWWPDKHGRSPSPDEVHAPLQRVEFDPSSSNDKGRVTDVFTDLSVEFYKIDDRFLGKPYRYSYPIATDVSLWDFEQMGPPHPFFFNMLCKVDLENKSLTCWSPGETDSVQEPVFILRSDDAPEGDGYILLVVNRLKTNSSDLVLLDTENLSNGPIATIKCPFRMRQGLHGNWVNGLNQ
ncbi:carotenoid oxygenase family protein [Pokkaliibacter sp. MBI-7]|uniref:carotenoid oxygenase family protein n=1 Tax=Pokkaliibacter sp. MBI-7 TaxID=3040600 RepID=UPI0024476713|nr:carotenoid oxygenase family protein [Pokkaliibacter sp. MBI-7]MDH2435954.1 carotenoid oxygenase family protein [Pokkaliibacter sp. MBI-7]